MDLVTIRASSLPELFDCPAKWEAKHVNKMRLPSSPASTLGHAVHAGTAAYDLANMHGKPISVDDATGELVDTIYKPKDDVDWGDSKPQEAEKIGINLLRNYCATIAPQFNFVGVEATCERLEITDIGLALTGTTDRIYQTISDDPFGDPLSARPIYGVADIKTGAKAVSASGHVETKGHAAQLGVYELLASILIKQKLEAPAVIMGLQTAKTAKAQRVATGYIEGASELLVGTDERKGYLDMAASIVRSGSFYGNPRSMLCTEKYCPTYNSCTWRR
ncbi:MAG: PD-(D/E)XK nuclease family protein [Pseudomonadota bacterium]